MSVSASSGAASGSIISGSSGGLVAWASPREASPPATAGLDAVEARQHPFRDDESGAEAAARLTTPRDHCVDGTERR